MEPGRQRAEAWLADCTSAQREADRNAQQPAQEGAGEEIGGQAKLAGREPIAAQEGSGAARACAPTSPAPAWQPIETAPMDGTRVLLLVPSRFRPVVIGNWDDQRFHRRPRPYWQMTEMAAYDRGRQPYMWQPLPEPPEVSR